MKKLLDALWPRAEPDSALNPPDVFRKYYDALSDLAMSEDSGVNARLLEYSRYLYDDQERKWGMVLSRSTPTLTTTGLGLALFGGLATLFGQRKNPAAGPWILDFVVVALMLASLAYFLGALIDTLRVYGPGCRYTLDPVDLVPLVQRENVYSFNLSRSLMKYATENFKTHNRGVAFISSSQKRLRNGFVLLAIAAMLLLGLQVEGRIVSDVRDRSPQTYTFLDGDSGW